MSTSPPAVRIQNIAKSYTIVHEHRATTLGEAVATRLRNPRSTRSREEFWALKDVSFDVKQGEVVGVIGRNGAGKSTLLKILSRIATPTRGRIELHGRVGSLLEVGTGFHPELTGRENIFLNGAILGMRYREIERQFDAIVDFAGVEQFLDTPVKRYSSGMYVRLAFAVAAHLDSDVLIIDEVLAVGDAEFQKKCLGKIQSVASEEGRTVLFVSHNMASVQTLCERCVLLHQGSVFFDGNSVDASGQYMKLLQAQATGMETTGTADLQSGDFDFSHHENPHQEGVFIEKVTLQEKDEKTTCQFGMGETMIIHVDVNNRDLTSQEVSNTQLIFSIRSENGTIVSSAGSNMKASRKKLQPAQRERFTFQLPRLPFAPGNYRLDLLLFTNDGLQLKKLDRIRHLMSFQINQSNVYRSGYEFAPHDGMVFLDLEWERQPLEN